VAKLLNIAKISNIKFFKYGTTYNITLCKIKLIILASWLAVWLFAQPAEAAVTFSFHYLNPGQGFDDPTFGADRKAVLNGAADQLGSYFTHYTAHLTYDVTSSYVNGSTLASSGSYMFLSPGSFQQSFVQTKILSNDRYDGNGSAADGNIGWNFFAKWGHSDTVAANEYDLKQVAMHELLHTFGFSSDISEGGKGLGGHAPGTVDTWATFDSFLTDATGKRLISPTGIFDSSKVAALTGGSSVFFNGANATATNGGAGIPIYSPIIWKNGSSISHLDDNNPLTSPLLMVPSVGTGLGSRTLSPIEIGMLKDIGYASITAPTAVPLPAAIWFMVSGLLTLFGTCCRGSACAAKKMRR
jgi:hypothetical protein